MCFCSVVTHCACEGTFSHVLFLSFVLNRATLEKLAPALLSKFSVSLKPEVSFVFLKIINGVHTHGKRERSV